jgi:hypothetical protein
MGIFIEGVEKLIREMIHEEVTAILNNHASYQGVLAGRAGRRETWTAG